MKTQPILINLRQDLTLPANNDKLKLYSIIELKGKKALVSIFPNGSGQVFQIHLDTDSLYWDSETLSVFIKKGSYRVWMEENSISLHQYGNENEKIYYSLYSFFGSINEEKTDAKIIFNYVISSGDSSYSLVCINPSVAEESLVTINKKDEIISFSIFENGKIRRV